MHAHSRRSSPMQTRSCGLFTTAESLRTSVRLLPNRRSSSRRGIRALIYAELCVVNDQQGRTVQPFHGQFFVQGDIRPVHDSLSCLYTYPTGGLASITPVCWPEYTLPSPSLPRFLSRVTQKLETKRHRSRTSSLILIIIHFTPK